MIPGYAELLREYGCDTADILQTYGSGGIAMVFMRGGNPDPLLIVKIYRPGSSRPGLVQREAETLIALQPLAERLGVTRVLLRGETRWGGYLFAQAPLPGRTIPAELPTGSRAFADIVERVREWLERFQTSLPPARTMRERAAEVVGQCRECLELTGASRKLLDAVEGHYGEFEKIPAVAAHGDFWSGNILADGSRLSVIDWSHFHYGNPIEDLMSFSYSAATQEFSTGRTDLDRVCGFLSGRGRVAEFTRSATRGFLALHGMRPDHLGPLFQVFLATRLSNVEMAWDHPLWRELIRRYVAAGMPAPFESAF